MHQKYMCLVLAVSLGFAPGCQTLRGLGGGSSPAAATAEPSFVVDPNSDANKKLVPEGVNPTPIKKEELKRATQTQQEQAAQKQVANLPPTQSGASFKPAVLPVQFVSLEGDIDARVKIEMIERQTQYYQEEGKMRIRYDADPSIDNADYLGKRLVTGQKPGMVHFGSYTKVVMTNDPEFAKEITGLSGAMIAISVTSPVRQTFIPTNLDIHYPVYDEHRNRNALYAQGFRLKGKLHFQTLGASHQRLWVIFPLPSGQQVTDTDGEVRNFPNLVEEIKRGFMPSFVFHGPLYDKTGLVTSRAYLPVDKHFRDTQECYISFGGANCSLVAACDDESEGFHLRLTQLILPQERPFIAPESVEPTTIAARTF